MVTIGESRSTYLNPRHCKYCRSKQVDGLGVEVTNPGLQKRDIKVGIMVRGEVGVEVCV